MIYRRFFEIIEIIDQFIACILIYRSGLFNGDVYRILNPACTFGTTRCIWHWVRHGVSEERIPSHDAFDIWALALLARREVPISKVKLLAKQKNKENFEYHCQAAGINISEIHFLEAYESGQFDNAIEALFKTTGLFFLRKVHSSMRRMPVLPDLKKCYKIICADTSIRFTSLKRRDQKKVYDIALAAGCSWEELTTLANQINSRRDNRSDLSIGHVNGSASEISTFAKLAEHNSKNERNFLALQSEENKLIINPATKNSIIVFVPDDDFSSSSEYTPKFISDCIREIVQILLDENESIVFLPMPFARDLSDTNLPFKKAISYHTFAANRSDILHYKEGCLRNFLLIDGSGYSGASSLSKLDEIDEHRPETLLAIRNDYKSSSITKYDQPGNEQNIPAPGYVFVPMQVTDDSVRRWQYLSSIEIVEALAGQDFQLDGNPIVVKPHPFDNSMTTRDILEKLSDQEKIHVVNAPIQPLLEGSKIVVTANSGVGLEALLMEKPVILTGESEYRSAVALCKNEDQLFAEVKRILDDVTSFDVNEVEAFLHKFFSSHFIKPMTPEGKEHLKSFLVSHLDKNEA